MTGSDAEGEEENDEGIDGNFSIHVAPLFSSSTNERRLSLGNSLEILGGLSASSCSEEMHQLRRPIGKNSASFNLNGSKAVVDMSGLCCSFQFDFLDIEADIRHALAAL